MKKLESNFKNMVLVLCGITLFAAVALASIYTLTKEPITLSKVAKQQNAIKFVLPPFDHLAPKPIEVNDGVEIMKIFKAYDRNNTFVGAAVESSSNNGFSGKISVMVGFDKTGTIVNYSVLEQKETPGLGAKMVNWFNTNIKHQSIIGKNPSTANLSVSKDGGEVDAITAATISSRAFLFAIRNAYFAYSTNLDVPSVNSNSTEINIQNSEKDSVSTNNNTEMKGKNNE